MLFFICLKFLLYSKNEIDFETYYFSIANCTGFFFWETECTIENESQFWFGLGIQKGRKNSFRLGENPVKAEVGIAIIILKTPSLKKSIKITSSSERLQNGTLTISK